MFQNSTVIRPRCARCAQSLSVAAHVAALTVPSDVPPILLCSRCHGAVLTDAEAAQALRTLVLRGPKRHSLARQRAERLFSGGAH